MDQPVKDGRGYGRITEKISPFIKSTFKNPALSILMQGLSAV